MISTFIGCLKSIRAFLRKSTAKTVKALKAAACINRMRLQTKMILLFMICAFIPMTIISFVYYETSSAVLLENAQNELQSLVRKNSELMSAQFSTVNDTSLYLTVDSDISGLLNGPPPVSELDAIRKNNQIMAWLERYFFTMPDIFSYHLATDYYGMVGNQYNPVIVSSTPKMYVPAEAFLDSELYRIAAGGEGSLEWAPTYNYEEMYQDFRYSELQYPYRYLFSAVKQINCIDDTSGGRWNPILIISYLPEYFAAIFEREDTPWDTAYYLLTEEGSIVYSTAGEAPGEKADSELLEIIYSKDSGAKTKRGGQRVVCVSEIQQETGWVLAACVPYQNIVSKLSVLPRIVLMMNILLIVVFIFASILLSRRLTKPLEQIVQGMDRMGEGDFKQKLVVPQNPEIGFLASRFNVMSDTIDQLITENYEVKLREKENQIAILNLQMNPHFLYNTLNTINWMALEAGNEDVSEMLVNLSQMMQYSLKRKGDEHSLEQDLKWLDRYIYIMKTRYEDKFEVAYDVESTLLSSMVPVYMFQPLVENAIVHGLEEMEAGGWIHIAAKAADGCRVFTVEDNGKGINSNHAERYLFQKQNGIGLSNLNHRIKILYGTAYGLQITSENRQGVRITVTLPLSPFE